MKAFFRKKRVRVILIILSVIIIVLGVWFLSVRSEALKRFAAYEAMAESIHTSYGKISYIDKGKGEPFIIVHGIMGGYDQGFDVMGERTESYRVIAPSRFGYPGSDIPENATVDMQVEAFVEFLDKLKIEKAFITATSAGGTVAERFALLHPERCKGLVLYCSGYPEKNKPTEPADGMTGPPSFICNDFMMWLISPLFKPMMGMDSNVIKQIMPIGKRKQGIEFDSDVVNKDCTDNYDNYNLKNIKIPVLIIHSEDDKLADPANAKYWSEQIPGCKSVFFAGGGHLMNGKSDEINQVVDEFVEENK